MSQKPKIVVLGAGYAGLKTTRDLTKLLSPEEADIVLVNKHNYHYETTWLHENAAGTLHHDRSRIDIKDVINSAKVNFVKDTVTAIKPDEKKVELAGGVIEYDYLVIALGFEPATFGIPGIEEYAFTIGSINQARLIREHIEYQFAQYNNDFNQARLNFVVGGGGFTGIEFLGELANRVKELCEEFDVDRSKVRLINVEAMDTIMPGFDPDLVDYAMKSLESRGVEFKLGAFLKEVREDGITIEQNGEKEDIPAMTTVWSAGVRANSLVEQSGLEHNRGKVEVTPELRVPSHEEIFVVGDCALIWNKETDRPYPPTAQIAMQEAEVCAHNLAALVNGGKLEQFEFIDRGTVCSLGEKDAMGSILGGKKIYGWFASVMKKVVDNRALFKIGGIGLVLKKGKFNIF